MLQAYYPYLLLAAIVLELGGGVLFLLGTSLGALLLLIVLAAVSWAAALPRAGARKRA